MVSKFFNEISKATIEKDVELTYSKGINVYFPEADIQHPFGCDGLIETKTIKKKLLKLIIEYKHDETFSSPVVRAKVITQVLFYLKQFELNGKILPNVCMVGDKNECFVFHTNDIISYLDESIDWSIAPSNAHKYNPDLVLKISQDEKVNPFVFNIDDNFSFKTVADKIIDLADNVQRYVHVTEHNIATIFDYFINNVIKDKKKINANDLVEIFIKVITDKDNYYQHPTKPNLLITPDKQLNIDGRGFNAFFSYFNRNYTPQETMKFDEISDRLIEDTNRRNKGEFYTPTLFVDYAHKMLGEQFGENWKDEYIVYDPCCGTLNLTRDYKFKELYCSTLEQAELNIGERYNPEATKFQYDFLNDSLDKLPNGLLNAFEQDKPIIIFMNPPYATSCAGGANTEHKTGCAKTMINEEMLKNKVGASSQNLYAQFLYRILMIKQEHNLTNINIGLFSPSLYLTGGSWKGFRNVYLDNFKYEQGCVFRASHFADVADNWGISFNIWKIGKTENKESFIHNIIDNIDGEINVIGNKNVYNIDNDYLASDWVREDVKKLKTYDVPQFSSAIKVKDEGKTLRGRMCDKSMGYFLNAGNNINENTMGVALMTSSHNKGNGLSIIPENFIKCTTLFSARKLITKDWINSKDEYLAPNTSHPQYKEFESDSIIYSLFNTSSNQSSLRQIEYKGKKWDIKNEFFWLSRQEMMDLSNEHNNHTCFYDAKNGDERYTYNLLQNTKLSEEAQQVLHKATELVKKSFKYRELFHSDNENYQINNFDCGFYQIKALCKEYLPNELKEFNELYKKLGDKMRPMVYELGFLLK